MKFSLISILLVGFSQATCEPFQKQLASLVTNLNANEASLKTLGENNVSLEAGINAAHAARVKEIADLTSQIEAAEAANAALAKALASIKQEMSSYVATNMEPNFQSVRLGDRWVIQPETDIALVIRDLKTGGDKRYAFYNGGHSDMYKSGTGGNVVVSRLSFPTRWAISEESGTYLVARDGVTTGTGKDSRYAFTANKYVDL